MAFACAPPPSRSDHQTGASAYRSTTPAPQTKPVAHAPRLVAQIAPLVAFGLGLSSPAAGPARATHTTPSASVCVAADPKVSEAAGGAIIRVESKVSVSRHRDAAVQPRQPEQRGTWAATDALHDARLRLGAGRLGAAGVVYGRRIGLVSDLVDASGLGDRPGGASFDRVVLTVARLSAVTATISPTVIVLPSAARPAPRPWSRHGAVPRLAGAAAELVASARHAPTASSLIAKLAVLQLVGWVCARRHLCCAPRLRPTIADRRTGLPALAP